LPGKKTKCKNKAARKKILDMMSGSIQGFYMAKQVDSSTMLALEIVEDVDTNNGSKPEGLMRINVVGRNALPGKRLTGVSYGASNKELLNFLTADEKELLSHRIAHYFYRAIASELPFCFLDDAVMVLHKYYPEQRYYREALDAKMIWADVAITR
jgi:hypothetical protein